jgi:hypothetical protein
MAAFTPVKNTLYLAEQYAKNGDIELIKLVDFSAFQKSEIRDLSSKIYSYICSKYDTGVHPDQIQKCLDYINDQHKKVFTWETSNFIIYSHCYYDNSGDCLHKVQAKDTGAINIAYCSDLARLANDEGRTIVHITK